MVVCAVFSSFFSPLHLKDLVVTEAVGLDKSDSGISLCVQLLNTNAVSTKAEANQSNSTITLQSECKSITQGLEKIQSALSKNMYFGHNKLFAISAECAQGGVFKNLPYSISSLDSRSDIALCITMCEALTVLKSEENNARVPCESIINLIKSNEKNGTSIYVSAVEALNVFENETDDLILPVLDYSKEDKACFCSSLALFDSDRLVRFADGENANGILLIIGRLSRCSMELETNELGKVTVELTNIKTKNDTNIIGDDVIFSTNLSFKVNVISCERKGVGELSKEDTKLIYKKTEEQVENLCKSSFDLCTKCGCDCFKCARRLSKQNPKAYLSVKDDWDNYFANAKADITACAE